MKAEILSLPQIIKKLPHPAVISLAGAGGKTTLMFTLGKQIPGACVLTTTTKVGEDQISEAEQQMTCSAFFDNEVRGKTIWVSPSLTPINGKICGCGSETFAALSEECALRGHPLIFESDGAARRHIKAPADHEPVIFPGTTVCFYLAGLDVLGKPVNPETVHRPEIFSRITGARNEDQITPDHIAALFDHPDGGLKKVPDTAIRIAYLTHADSGEKLKAGMYIAEQLTNYDYICIADRKRTK